MAPAPSAQFLPPSRPTDASLRVRLTTALDRDKQFADENAWLRCQLGPRPQRPAVGTEPIR